MKPVAVESIERVYYTHGYKHGGTSGRVEVCENFAA